MVESPDDPPPLLDRIRSKAHVFGLGYSKAEQPSVLPVIDNAILHQQQQQQQQQEDSTASPPAHRRQHSCHRRGVSDDEKTRLPPPAPPPASVQAASGEQRSPIETIGRKRSMVYRFFDTAKEILTYSILNVLLVFVPVGIAVRYAGVNPSVIFAVNAVALIPLAGLLAHATEAVAASLGDTIGALLNVTFGNAVELIIFIIALADNQIRIVQASIVGSILSNLLLILGMAFALGGLRYREQVYNSTVTQMSACLLSLSVTSLLLPTAFHASFSDGDLADDRVVQLSRGSAVILLLIYVLYLLFQLKSHSYMYASTPQHVIDEESHPGVLANMLNNSSSDSSSSSDSDSDSSSGSHGTAKKIKRALTGVKNRRKSSVGSRTSPSTASVTRNHSVCDVRAVRSPSSASSEHQLAALASGDEADADERHGHGIRRSRGSATQARDFEKERLDQNESHDRNNNNNNGDEKIKKNKGASRTRSKRTRNGRDDAAGGRDGQGVKDQEDQKDQMQSSDGKGQLKVIFVPAPLLDNDPPKRPLNLRTLSVRPAMPRFLGSTVFSETNSTGIPAPAGANVPRAPYGLRRTSSLPDRLNRTRSQPSGQTEQRVFPTQTELSAGTLEVDKEEVKKHMSRTSAIVLLLVSTGLVALCAEFLVGSIDYMVENTSLSQAFIGLVILPIVGNAAEHVTAVTVAMKNKMDLAIGVAVGSSIQIALFVTPFVIILGWCLGKEMSLYFSLFETIALFVSAFIINFLILDGRSNYLEGALLIAAYVIIAVAAFFYPADSQQSDIGGSPGDPVKMLMARGMGFL